MFRCILEKRFVVYSQNVLLYTRKTFCCILTKRFVVYSQNVSLYTRKTFRCILAKRFVVYSQNVSLYTCKTFCCIPLNIYFYKTDLCYLKNHYNTKYRQGINFKKSLSVEYGCALHYIINITNKCKSKPNVKCN